MKGGAWRHAWNALGLAALATMVVWAAGCGSSNKVAALPNTYNGCVRAGWSSSSPPPPGAIVAQPGPGHNRGSTTVIIYPKMRDPAAVRRCDRIAAHLHNTWKHYRNIYFALPSSYQRKVGWWKWAYRHGYVWSRGPWGDNRDLSGWLSKFNT